MVSRDRDGLGQPKRIMGKVKMASERTLTVYVGKSTSKIPSSRQRLMWFAVVYACVRVRYGALCVYISQRSRRMCFRPQRRCGLCVLKSTNPQQTSSRAAHMHIGGGALTSH